MANWLPLVSLVGVGLLAAYGRLSMKIWFASSIAICLAVSLPAGAHWFAISCTLFIFILLTFPFIWKPFRQSRLTRPLLAFYQRISPELSETEKIALEAGTVEWESDLFDGRPDWGKLLSLPVTELSAEEKAFLAGPCEQLCGMVSEWETCHQRADLSPQVWAFLKEHRFFGMIIPTQYGGLGFSALAHHRVIAKAASISTTLSSTIAVPNSLGPAELILHYGTDAQKERYLPRLARGEDIPCFALTNPWAGSDATSIPDFGIVCKQARDGQDVLGVKLTFDKRYITLAPVATVVGLAFRLYDPEQLLSPIADRGISLALIPRDTPGLEIGNRHLPLNIPFMNGPVRGKEVFLPLVDLIGGETHIGHGWRMLVECLSVGRAISLPATSTGSSKMAAATTGAYARVRKQFQMPIGRFEGVEEALARIAGHTYAITALAEMTACAVDRGHKPAVSSAIAKYHATEIGRNIVKDAMDVHGGKGVILGPKNYLGRFWQAAPISITVEGANILTRSMMIFGQGAVRCHPFVLKEMQAARMEDATQRLAAFDEVLFAHIGHTISNAARAFCLGLFWRVLGKTPKRSAVKPFYRKLNRHAAAFALLADLVMVILGGKLKQKEKISARLGDALSGLYIASATLKRFENQGAIMADKPIMAWAVHDMLHRVQTALIGILDNFPIRWLGGILHCLLYPLGARDKAPSDLLGHRAASLLLSPSETRDRLIDGAFMGGPGQELDLLRRALPIAIAADPLERKLQKAIKAKDIDAIAFEQQLVQAFEKSVLSDAECTQLREARVLIAQVIAVDDFASSELAAGTP